MLINSVLSSFQHHLSKILMYFDNSCLVETNKVNHYRMIAADTYYSIHLYIFIARYKNVCLEKRTGTATNTYTRELHGKRHNLMRLTFFGHFQNSVISSLQMLEL